MIQTYNQPSKIATRRRALEHAVELLTSRRENAAIVPDDYVGRVRDILRSRGRPDNNVAADCDDADILSWRTFRQQSVGSRSAEQLTVAYLAGPEPSNDLLELIRLGLRPENIWAFEVEESAIRSAVTDLEAREIRGVKFVPVEIAHFFAGAARRFDIIYIDACGTFPSDSAKTVRVLVDLFRHSALAPLGVLVTNFSMPDISDAAALDNYAFLSAAYLYPKDFHERVDGGMDEGPLCHGYQLRSVIEPTECFVSEVKRNFQHYYGAFITRHAMDIAAMVAPLCRLADARLYRVLFDADIGKAAAQGKKFVRFGADNEDGDAIVDPDLYSLVWTLAACALIPGDENFDAPTEAEAKFASKWRNQLGGSRPDMPRVEDLIAAYYAWRSDQTLWSDAMRRIGDYPFAVQMPFLCDVPTAELGFYPAFAQLSTPAHLNIGETRRYSYVAEGKKARMFLDVLPFDECRYIYDWISTLHLVPGDWNDLSAQLTFRFALDGLAKNNRWFGADYLFGCHVVGIDAIDPGELRSREFVS